MQSSFLRSCTTYCLCNLFIDRFFLTKAFLSESGCKDKDFISYLPNFFEVFFIFLFQGFFAKRCLTKITAKLTFLTECKQKMISNCESFVPHISECHFVAALVLESGCKSSGFLIMLQIYQTLFFIFLMKFLLNN